VGADQEVRNEMIPRATLPPIILDDAAEEAITAFDDPFALVAADPGHSTREEERRWLIR
jgi:hypothetical protein